MLTRWLGDPHIGQRKLTVCLGCCQQLYSQGHVHVLRYRPQTVQEIPSPGNNVAATKFPRIYGRPSITERPYFLGNIAASSIFCRSQVHANDDRLSFWDGSKYNILLTCPPWRFQKNGNDYFRRKSKSVLANATSRLEKNNRDRSMGVTDKYLNNSQLVRYCSQWKP